MGAAWGQPMPVALPSSAGQVWCWQWLWPPLSMGMDLWEESHKLLHPPGGKAVGFGGLPWGRDSFLAPCPLLSPSHNVDLQVSEKEAGKSAEEEGGEEGGHAGEEPAARWEWSGGAEVTPSPGGEAGLGILRVSR